MMTHYQKHIAIVDPATSKPEIDCFNNLILRAKGPFSYHLPALFGFDSLAASSDGIIGIILLGSLASVHDEAPWQKELSAWLTSLWSRRIPTLGICFGHQFIADILGGVVERQPFEFKGMRTVHVHDDPLFGPGTSGDLVVSHHEIVTRLPSCCRVFASSNEVAVDGLAHTTLPIWGLQPHPEATPLFLHEERISLPASKQEYDPFSFGHQLLNRFMSLAWDLMASGV